MLLENLKQILDLEEPKHEAKKKLTGTWMVVNNVLTLVNDFDFTKTPIKCFVSKGGLSTYISDPLTIEPFLPESGIYKLNHYWVIIEKRPVRQWLKSMADSFYSIKTLSNYDLVFNTIENIDTKQKPQYIVLDLDKTLYYWNMPIGYLNENNKLILTNINYKHEVQKWIQS